MFGIGTTEILMILVVALIVLGPKSLPKIARTLGKGMAEFRRVSTDFQRTINTEIDLEDHEKRKKAAAKRLYDEDDEADATPKPKKAKKAKPKATAQKTSGDLEVAPDATASSARPATDTSVSAEADETIGDNA